MFLPFLGDVCEQALRNGVSPAYHYFWWLWATYFFCHLYGQHILSEPLVFRGSLFLSTVGGVCPKSAFLAVCCMPSTLSSYTCLMGVTLPFGQVYAMVCLVCTFWLGPLCVHVISAWPAGLFLSLGVGWMLRGAVF